MRVRFWGTRGSIAAPGSKTAAYGGNTCCVEVRASDGTTIVLDCGTGARELGLELVRTAPQPLRLHLFIGHTHWDHIQGFPFFVPAFRRGVELNIYAPIGFQRSLEDALAGQMEYAYFPVKLRNLQSRIHYTELDEGFFRVGPVLVETQYLNHTAPTIGYRLSCDGGTLAYATDHEPFWSATSGASRHPGDERHIAFLKGADLVIHDAQYTDEEYRDKLGWGHCAATYAVDVAGAAGAGQLVLYHHDPTHDDQTMERMEAEARVRAAARAPGLVVLAAREGLELEVRGRGAAPAADAASAFQHRRIRGGRVLVVSANDGDAAEIEEVLSEDGLVLLRLDDVGSALRRAPELQPDLAIIDRELLDARAGEAALAALRERLGRPNFPIVALADSSLEPDAMDFGDASCTDHLAKPFSPPMLRARVRAWLARTLAAPEGVRAPPTDAHAPPAAERGEEGDPRPRLARLLAAAPLFRPLAGELRERLISRAKEHVFAPGHVIIQEHDPPDCVFVILAGRARVFEVMPDNPVEIVLGEVGEGEIIGELGVLREKGRSASVMAIERTHCLALPKDDFLRALQGSAELALSLLRLLAARLHETDRRLSRYAPDAVTGLASRRAFHDQYRRLAAVARRRGTGAVLILVDVVQLKTVNDRFGYGAGDEVLRTVADALVESTRTADLVARHGGDEFVAFFPDTARGDAELVIRRVRERISALAGRRGLPSPLRCGIGLAFREAPPDSPDELLREADEDMRRRKV